MFGGKYFGNNYFGKSFWGHVGDASVTWTLILQYDPTWIGNSPNMVRVQGFLTSRQVQIVPGIPEGTQ